MILEWQGCDQKLLLAVGAGQVRLVIAHLWYGESPVYLSIYTRGKKNKGRPSPVKEIVARFITDFWNEQGNDLFYRFKEKYKDGRNGHTLATLSESPQARRPIG